MFWLLFVGGVVGAIYAIPQVLTRTLNSEHPTLTVISQSMYPALNRGDLILVRAVSREEIQVGTVIVFRHESGLAVHRVVRLDDETLTTRGDANPKEDQPITYDDVIGRVPTIGDSLVKIPLIGRISLLAGIEPSDSQAETSLLKQMARYVWNPLGFSMLVLLPAVLFFGNVAGDFITLLSPNRRRKQLLKRRAERLKRRWPQARMR